MSDPKKNPKAIEPKIIAAIETVARERLPNGFRIDRDDLKSIMGIITIDKTRPGNSCSHVHEVELSVQPADFRLRVYSRLPVKQGAAIAGGLGAAVGAAGGTAGGIAAGAAIGTIVPVAGNIVGGIIGGVVGFFGGLVAGGGAGAGTGAGLGAADSNNRHHIVYAYDVFRKFKEYSKEEANNTCHCVLIAPI